MVSRVEIGGGPFHMEADAVMLRRARTGLWGYRVYTWDGVWVSLGRNQIASDVLVDLATPHVLRPTGGAAVLHGHDVTVSIAIPLLRPRADSYRIVTRPLIEALGDLGAFVAFADSRSGTYTEMADCFATTTKNDLVDVKAGHKVVGCALRRTRDAVLLQASIPVRPPLALPSAVIREGVATAVTPLSAEDLHTRLAQALAAMQLIRSHANADLRGRFLYRGNLQGQSGRCLPAATGKARFLDAIFGRRDESCRDCLCALHGSGT